MCQESADATHETLRTERLRLRRFTSSDVDKLLELYTDPQVMRYLDNETWTKARIADELLPSFLAEYRRYGRFGYWAAETETGSFVGRIALHPVIIDPDPNALWQHAPTDKAATVSIGYRICRRYWRQGYASEAAAAITELAFRKYGSATRWRPRWRSTPAPDGCWNASASGTPGPSIWSGTTRSREPSRVRSSTSAGRDFFTLSELDSTLE